MRAFILFLCTWAFTAHAQLTPTSSFDNISVAVGEPGDPATWGLICGAGAVEPSRASQVSACDPLLETCFSRTTIPAAEFPRARCSDGTPGVFYVKPGVGDDVDKWVIHLQGGGSCRDHGTCLERWCGQQGAVPYSANKMSSDWDADGTIDLPLNGRVGGMSDFAAGNDFADWTHVWMYYCSSDSWMGRKSNVDYADPGGTLDFSVDHRGHTILYAARRMLRQRSAAWTTDDGLAVPDLDDADEVVFTGTSAGAKGAVQNVDWFLRPLSAARKVFVMDANFGATDDALLSNDIWVDLDGDLNGDVLYYSHQISMTLDSWDTGWLGDVNAFVDQSCRDIYEPSNRLDRCSLLGPLLTLRNGTIPFLETETFVRLDLQEGSVSKPWTGNWPTGERLMVGQFGRVTTKDDFTQLMRQSMLQLYDDPDLNITGIFGPRCGKHVGLESGDAYDGHNTPNATWTLIFGWSAGATSYTTHDAIMEWYTNPGVPFRALDTADVGDPVAPNNPVSDPVVQFSAGPGCAY